MNKREERSAMAQIALQFIPPMISSTLLSDSDFREEYGFEVDAVLSFAGSSLRIQRRAFFDAIRGILAGAPEKTVTAKDGRSWILKREKEGEHTFFRISSDEEQSVLSDFAALSPNRDERLSSFNDSAKDVNLPKDAFDRWHGVLSERALDDNELEEYHDEFRDTPVHVARAIRAEIKTGTSTVSSLVPASRKYYERLVGVYDGSSHVEEYAHGGGKLFFENLSRWDSFNGFLHSLLLSSHSTLAAEVPVERLEADDLLRALKFLQTNGDSLSRLGGVEIGLALLRDRPDVEPHIVRLIRQICEDDLSGRSDGIWIVSALFLLVHGRLSQIRLLSDTPPFYTRLASFAHAALINRQLVGRRLNFDALCTWASECTYEEYYWRALADMRSNPRWHPGFAGKSQLKQEFLGRILIAAEKHAADAQSEELRNLLFDDGPGSVRAFCEFPCPFMAGPLDGVESPSQKAPPEVVEFIESQLSSSHSRRPGIIALVNAASLSLKSETVELAATSLAHSQYRLPEVEDRTELLEILLGLARIAASTRNKALAEGLRVLVRVYMHDAEYSVSSNEALNLCLVAAAAFPDVNDWCDFVGGWLTELAFGEDRDNEGKALHHRLQILCNAMPELWFSCGKADAALQAFIKIRM